MSREEEKTEQRGILGLAEAFVGTLSFSWRRTGPPSPPVDSGAFDSPNSPGPAKSTSEPDTSTHTKNPSPPYPKPTPTSPTTTPSPSQTQSTSTLGVPTVTTVRGISLHDTTPPRVPLIDVSKLRRITREEVATHNTKRDCWVILHGLVLDVTKYAPFHPGGSRFIIQSAGTLKAISFLLFPLSKGFISPGMLFVLYSFTLTTTLLSILVIPYDYFRQRYFC